MLTPEKTTNFKLEIPQTPENQRITIAYHDYFSKFHHDFHRSIVKLLQQDTNNQEIPGRGFPIGYLHGFGNKSQIYAALEKTDTGKSDAVIAPVWFAPPEADSLYSILQICSSFTQSSSSENNTITDNLILVFPYAELRQDKNTPRQQRTYWKEKARESITTNITANSIASNGATTAIFNHPHSEEAISPFIQNMEVLCLTPSPLFAQWSKNLGLNNGNTDIISLDEGAAQECHYLASLTNSGLVVLKKDRPEAEEIDNQHIIIGKPQAKTAIIRDDLAASCGSIFETLKVAQKLGYEEIYLCITHAVLSEGYRKNLTKIQDTGLVQGFAITNSLPASEDAPFLPIIPDVIPVEQMLAFFAKQVALSSVKEVTSNPEWSEYIYTPFPKNEVIEKLKQIYG